MKSLILSIFKNSMNLFLLLTLYRKYNTQKNPHKFEFIC